MKFRIRYADQVVGVFVILALALLAFMVVAVGSNQRWFARDYIFYSRFSSGSGLSSGTPLLLKGFQIGRIHEIKLNANNEADVVFKIYDTYLDKVRENSLLELVTSPIGLGNQLLFHPGKSEALAVEKSFIPSYDTPEGKRLVDAGLVNRPPKDDTITRLLSNINPLIENINDTVLGLETLIAEISGVFKGSGSGPIAVALDNAAAAVQNVKTLVGNVDGLVTDARGVVSDTNDRIGGLTNDVSGLIVDTKAKAYGAVDQAMGIIGEVKDKSFSTVDQVMATVADVKEKTYTVVDDAALMVREVKDKAFGVVDQVSGVIDETKGKAFGVVDEVNNTIVQTREKAFGVIDETKDKAFGVVDQVSGVIDETKDKAFVIVDEVNGTITQTKDKAFGVVDELNATVVQAREKALSLVDGLNAVIAEARAKAMGIIGTVEEAVPPLLAKVDGVAVNVVDITANLKATTEAIRDPTGLVPKLLDPQGSIKTFLNDGDRLFDRVDNSLAQVEGTLTNLKDSTATLSGQMPKIVTTIEELRSAIVKAQDVLEGLKNNPLLRGGITEQVEPQAAPTSLRTTDF